MIIYKLYKETLTISAHRQKVDDKKIDFYSFDQQTAKITVQIKSPGDGKAFEAVQDVLIALERGGKKAVHNMTVEDYNENLVSFVLPDNIISQSGSFLCGIYLDYGNNKSLDVGYFRINLKQSLIDKDLPAMEQFYVQSFEELKDDIIQRSSDLQAIIDGIDTDVADKLQTLDDLAEDYAQKAADLEATYAPRLTEVTAQLAQTEEQIESTGTLAGFSNESKFLINSDVKDNKVYMTIVDDDARKEVWSVLKPISEEFGVPITVAAPVDDVQTKNTPEERLTKEQLLYLQNELGWEISGHSYTHQELRIMTEREIDWELRQSRYVLESWGLNIKNFVAPYGTNDSETVRRVASRYYNCSASVSKAINKKPISNHYLNRFPLGSFGSASELTLETYKAKLDEAIENNGWVIYMTHVWHTPEHTAQQTQYLRELIQYAKSKGVEIVNLQDGFEAMGNYLETEGVFSIGHDGNMRGLKGVSDVLTNLDRSQTSESPPTEYKRQHTINDITHAKKGSYPDIGILHTFVPPVYDGGTYDWSYQLLYGYSQGIFYRRSNASATGWDSWLNLLDGVPKKQTVATTLPTIPANGAATLTIPAIFSGTTYTLSPSNLYDEILWSVARKGGSSLTVRLLNTSESSLPSRQVEWYVSSIGY